METHFSEQTDVHEGRHCNWKPLMRQILVCSGVCAAYFTYGLCLGTPTVLIPQLNREANSTTFVSKEMASWLSSVFGYAALPWVIIIPILTTYFGRKMPFLFSVITTVLAFILLYFSSSIKYILVSEIMQSIIAACIYTLCFLIISEYTSPKYRGVFLTLKSASIYWGVWIANAIGTFFHWKNIPIFGLICALFCVVSVFNWPLSPYWLASKGRFMECAVAHRWLKGTDEDSEKELHKLIESHKLTQMKIGADNVGLLQRLSSKEFYKSNLLCCLLIIQYYVSGKLVCSIYAIDVIRNVSGEEAAYKGMLILDGITVCGMYIGCGLAKKFKRRDLLMTASLSTILFLLSMSFYLYLVKLNVVQENKYVSLFLFAAYSLSVCCGPTILSTAISAELIPLKSRSISGCLNALLAKLAMGTIVKVSPYLFEKCGMHGAFLFYAFASSFCLLILYFYLPETKDITLHEIQNLICKRGTDTINKSTEFTPLDIEAKTLRTEKNYFLNTTS